MDSDDFNDYTPGVTSPGQSTSGVPSTAQRSSSRPTNAGKPAGEASAGGGPVRKQRRVKDPYAIDSDSDEDDTLTALPAGRAPPRPARDESLADFLRNTEPPAANGPAPLAVVLPNGAAPGSARTSRSALLASAASSSARTPSSAAAPSADPAPRPPPKRRLEARVAGATRDFQTREYRQPTADLASFLDSSGPVDGADGPGAGSGSVGLKSGVGSKRGRQRGWLGLRVSRSIDA